jgi:hypothetical protein
MSENLEKSISIEIKFGFTSIYGIRMVTDDHMIELLAYLLKLSQVQPIKLTSFILHNAKLSDAGVSILLDYLEVHGATLK